MAQSAPIPKNINLAVAAVIMLAILCQLLVLPWVLADQPWVLAGVIVALVAVNTPFWSLIHEGIHRNLHPDRPMNEGVSRLMSVIFGASFHVLRFGHLMHHQYNRAWESEIYHPPQKKWLVALNHYFKMTCGIYLIEVLLSFLVALTPGRITQQVADRLFTDPQHRQAVRQMLQKPGNVARLRFDCAMIVALYGAAFYLYGALWPLLLLMIAGRAFVISFMDNAYHYDTPPDNSVPALELRAPGMIEKMIFNFNYHMTHHKNAGLPWSALAREHQAQGRNFDADLLPAMLAQFKGPIDGRKFDQENKQA